MKPLQNEFPVNANRNVNKNLITINLIKKGYNFVPNNELRPTWLKASGVS